MDRSDDTVDATKRRLRTLGLVMISGLLLAAMALSATAAAHECVSNNHGGCNGHDCPDDGDTHDHKTAHDWSPDHWCQSQPATGMILEGVGSQITSVTFADGSTVSLV